ncbi:hypothetical protein Q1695_006878 [Nippostrongylus brasiliensis]|nr:hypothetical protein Q1695_006878 [Nippostrongylus brasiliensis]
MFSDRALGRRYQNNIIEQERETCLTQLWEVEVLDRRKKRARICSCSGAARQRINSFLLYMGLSGLFPIQPKTIIKARYNREQVAKSAFGDSVETTEVVEVALRRTEYFCGCSRTC